MLGDHGEIFLLLSIIAPLSQRNTNKSVLNVDHDGDGGVYLRELFDHDYRGREAHT